MWTAGNAISPTPLGEEHTPSLDDFTSNRSFKVGQIEADAAWEVEAAFGEGPAGVDPVVLYNVDTGGRVGIWMQVSNDGLNRGDVGTEIFNSWVPTVLKPQSVDADGKVTTTWGELKGF